MRFYLEWALAMHRAAWFPLLWALGLDRPGVDVPPEIGGAMAGPALMPAVIHLAMEPHHQSGRTPRRTAGTRSPA